MFKNMKKSFLCVALVGSAVSGSCFGSEGFKSFDDVYTAYHNLKTGQNTENIQQNIAIKIQQTAKDTKQNQYNRVAILWKARKLLGNFFINTIDEAVSSIIGLNINDTTNYSQYVNNRILLACTLFQSQSNVNCMANFPNVNIDALTLRDGYSPCTLDYAIEILDDIQNNNTAQQLMGKIEELKQ